MTDDSANFMAAFPDIQSAIKVGKDGMRIQLDIPESEMAQAIKLMTMRDVVLQVSVTPVSQETFGKQDVRCGGTVSRRAAKRRN